MLLLTTSAAEVVPIHKIEQEWDGPREWLPPPMAPKKALVYAINRVAEVCALRLDFNPNSISILGSTISVHLKVWESPRHLGTGDLQIKQGEVNTIKWAQWKEHSVGASGIEKTLTKTILSEWEAMLQCIEPRIWTQVLRNVGVYMLGGLVIGAGPILYLRPGSAEQSLFDLLKLSGVGPVLLDETPRGGFLEAAGKAAIIVFSELKGDIDNALGKKTRPHASTVDQLLHRINNIQWLTGISRETRALYDELVPLKDALTNRRKEENNE